MDPHQHFFALWLTLSSIARTLGDRAAEVLDAHVAGDTALARGHYGVVEASIYDDRALQVSDSYTKWAKGIFTS